MHADIAVWKDRATYYEFGAHKIAYWTGGRDIGEARSLLLIHGYPTASYDWHAVWDRLGAHYHLIACDMLGFGFSDKPRQGFTGTGYSLHEQADLHLALLKSLGVSEFDALVHDYGVSVGQEILARHAEGSDAAGLGQMIFLNGGIFPDFHRPRPIQKLGISPIGFLLGWLMTRDRFGKSFSEVFGPETQPSKEELDTFWNLIAHNQGNRIQHKLLQYMNDRQTHKQRWQHALEANRARIGLIDGALDPVSGEHLYDRWREVLPDARHHLLPKVGHYPQVEAPDEVASKVLEWLS